MNASNISNVWSMPYHAFSVERFWNVLDYRRDRRLTELVVNQSVYLRSIFVLVKPGELIHLADEYKDGRVRDINNEAYPSVLLLLILEFFVRRLTHKKWTKPGEALPSLSNGMIHQAIKAFVGLAEFTIYRWVYNKWHFLDDGLVSWGSWLGWIIGVLFYDFCYYLYHRAMHEVAFLWATHQAHHSPNTFNLANALSLAHLQEFWHLGLVDVPMALFGIPTHVTFFHKYLNLLYQFWIHTEVINKFPAPIEFFFNTPSHHRVHHGRNRKYIDKNYAGILIIWDRMFGTFEAEDEKPIYGLTTPNASLNSFYMQHSKFYELYQKVKAQKCLSHKIQAIFKGPGWEPGTPWTGDPNKIPDVRIVATPECPNLSWFWTIYILFQYLQLGLILFTLFLIRHEEMSRSVLLGLISFMYFASWSTGAIMENREIGVYLELVRSIIQLTLESTTKSFFARFTEFERFAVDVAAFLNLITLALCVAVIIERYANIKHKFLFL